jgi:hypothetical protein
MIACTENFLSDLAGYLASLVHSLSMLDATFPNFADKLRITSEHEDSEITFGCFHLSRHFRGPGILGFARGKTVDGRPSPPQGLPNGWRRNKSVAKRKLLPVSDVDADKVVEFVA